MTMLERYKQAEKLLPWNIKEAVLNGQPKVNWLDDESFYYAKEERIDGKFNISYIKVNCATTKETELFDNRALKKALDVECLPNVTFKIEGQSYAFTHDGRKYAWHDDTKELEEKEYVYSSAYALAPDETKAIIRKKHDLYLIDTTTHLETRITFDGEEHNEYAKVAEYSGYVGMMRHQEEPVDVLWSPNSRYVLTYRLDERAVKDLYIIESYDEEGRDSIRPRLKTYKCAFPEDKDVPLAYYCLYDTETGVFQYLDIEPQVSGSSLLNPFFASAKWLNDETLYLTVVRRSHKSAAFYIANVDGTCKKVYEESAEDFLNVGTYGQLDGAPGYAYSNFVTSDLKTLVWQSEKENYARLYTIDVETGKEIQAITPKDIIVSQLLYWDDEWIYFYANCLKETSDPYYHYPSRVKYDGSEFTVLCKEDGEHHTSVNSKYIVDTYSRVDKSPITNIYTVEGEKVKELVQADISDLLDRGYVIPERFSVIASDNKTRLYGLIVKPRDFDASKTYPFIDYIYGGMQCINVPKAFAYKAGIEGREVLGGLEEFAQLGFVGIILDGLGTPMRGKEMHAISYENIHGCAGLKDHVYCLDQIKKLYPFIDLDRAGMWGNSGGGCATSRAMLEYPDVYKVGVSSAGNHDQRMYNESWTEHYYGAYKKEIYIKGDNTALAKNLKGKLFIVHGAVDDNVAMSQSIRLIDQLILEDKDFDFLILPRTDHNVPANPYFIRKKIDYFVRYLLQEEVPDYRFNKAE